VGNVFILKREYLLDSGSFGDFGNKGYYEEYKITLTFSVLNLCPVSERNHVMMSG
jgi:hypothetical protein